MLDKIIENNLYADLTKRYIKMATGTASEERVTAMMANVRKNCNIWPKDKTGRWVGYVQCLLIEVEHVTTTKEERDFTRPLFHELYAAQGHDIPPTVEI